MSQSLRRLDDCNHKSREQMECDVWSSVEEGDGCLRVDMQSPNDVHRHHQSHIPGRTDRALSHASMLTASEHSKSFRIARHIILAYF